MTVEAVTVEAMTVEAAAVETAAVIAASVKAAVAFEVVGTRLHALVDKEGAGPHTIV